MVWITLYKAKSPKMRRPLLKKSDCREVSRKIKVAMKYHYVLWFTGEEKRHHFSDDTLKEMEGDGELKTVWYDGFKVYIHPSIHVGEFWEPVHGLGVAECLVRLWRSDTSGEVITARRFKGLNVMPDAVIKYGEKMLFIEFGTKSNSKRWGIYTNKINKYRQAFPEAVVLFVLDTTREKVSNYIKSNQFEGNFYFTDFETFKSVSIGNQLTAPIYFWTDGKEYPLREPIL